MQVNDTPRKPRYAALEKTEPVSRRTIVSRVVLGVVAVALLAGMIIQFTPNLGGGGSTQAEGKTLFTVNGLPVTEREVERARQQNPLLSQSPDGVLGQDLQNFLLSQIVLLKAAESDSRQVRLSGDAVAKQLTEIRASQNWQQDAQYKAGIQGAGYTDASFRDYIATRLKIQERVKQIQEEQKISDAELKLFYDLNKANYKNEEQIEARQIVVNDQKTADEVKAKLKAGGDFVALVKEYSKDESSKAEDGAINSEKGKKTPRAIVQLALPTNVATAAFKLTDGGVTDPIAEGGKFYILKVEKHTPAGQQDFAEAKTKIKDGAKEAQLVLDAKQAKANGAVENWIETLEDKAKVEFTKDGTDSGLSFFNPTVAKVGTKEIKLKSLVREVFSNPQIGQFLQQGGAAQSGQLIEQFFKPQTLQNLIQRAVVVDAAKKTGQPFFGAANDVLQAVRQWQTRDLKVTEAEAQKYYNDNKALYTTPASANLSEATFKTIDAAKAFRRAFITQGGGDFTKSAAKQQGTVSELGAQTPEQIAPEYKTIVFDAKALQKVGALEISDVIQKNNQFVVLGATSYVEKTVKPFSEARADAEEKALAAKRSTEGQKWVDAQVKAAKPQNLYEGVRKQLEARAAEETKRKAAEEAKRKEEDAKRKADEAAKNPPLEIKGAPEGADITVLDGTTEVQKTKALGQAVTFKLPNGFYTVKVSAKGFKDFSKEVRFPEEKALDVKLEKQ
jgi:parvulin-like peptidyl-prolyl isomerase